MADKALTGAALVLLRPKTTHVYTNGNYSLNMEDQETQGIFPTGRLPYFSSINIPAARAEECFENGFTTAGFWYGSAQANIASVRVCAKAGLKIHAMIRNIRPVATGSKGGYESELCQYYYNDPKAPYGGNRALMVAALRADMDVYYNDPDVGSRNIAAWATWTDDLRMNWAGCFRGSGHPSGCGANRKYHGGPSGYNRAQMLVAENHNWREITKYDKIKSHHKARPVSTSGLAGMYTSRSYPDHIPASGITNEQTYYGGGSTLGNGDKGETTRYIIGNSVQRMLYSSSRFPDTTNELPRQIAPLLPILQNSFVDARAPAVRGEGFNTVDALIRQVTHDVLLVMVKGGTGVGWYKFSRFKEMTAVVWDGYQKGIFHIFSILRNHQIGQALIWGKQNAGSITVTSPQSAAVRTRGFWKTSKDDLTRCDVGNSCRMTADMLNYAVLKYKGARYVVVTNSMPHQDAVDFWDIGGRQNAVSRSSFPSVHTTTPYTMFRYTGSGTKHNHYFVLDPTYGKDTVGGGGANSGKGDWRDVGDTGNKSVSLAGNNNGVIDIVVRGLPTDVSKNQIKVTELVGKKGGWGASNVTVSSSGTISKRLNPLDSVIFKIEAADGWTSGADVDDAGFGDDSGGGGGVISQTDPVITSQPDTVNAHPGNNVVFTVTARSGDGAPANDSLTYQWYWKNPIYSSTSNSWRAISGQTSATYSKNNVNESMTNDMFKCLVKSGTGGEVYTDDALLFVAQASSGGTFDPNAAVHVDTPAGWQPASEVYVRVGTAWKLALEMKVKLAAGWKDLVSMKPPAVLAITSNPTSITLEEGRPVPSLYVDYAFPDDVVIQWQWRNLRLNKPWQNISKDGGDKVYTLIGSVVTLAQDADEFRAKITAGNQQVISAAAKVTVTKKAVVELVTNGTFANGVVGWKGEGATLKAVGGEVEIINIWNAGYGQLRNKVAIPVVKGQQYDVSFKLSTLTRMSCPFMIFNAENGAEVLNIYGNNSNKGKTYTARATANTNQFWIRAQVGSSALGQMLRLDNISIKKV